ncbi:hypothetical protein HPP92_002218 [Vanilla planifolia]|uniref:RING-type E3 ubiquitin transferase n=1 Tax=Vanilla planifolia TaxID=51239 RepID=A0A835S1D3_VANPL|nr:hypothetical protein HPP92_002218 [Vanilla planifolia]
MENRAEEVSLMLPESFSTVAIAISGSKNSKRAVKWALDKFIPEGMTHFRLLYVRPMISAVPTPLGIYIPIANVRDDVVAAYKKEIDWHTNAMLKSYEHLFYKRKVEMITTVIEADDVSDALSNAISKLKINKFVVSATHQNAFFRKVKGNNNLSSKIASFCPSFCTVYVVSKGKLASIRPATRAMYEITSCGSSSTVSQSFSSCSSTEKSDPSISDITSIESRIPVNQIDVNSELEKLRIELNCSQDMAENGSINDSDLMKKETKLKELYYTEEVIRELGIQGKENHELAGREVEHGIKSVRQKTLLRNDVEENAAQALCEKQVLEKSLSGDAEPYKIYTWEEIKSSTLSFSDAMKIGMGAFGTVYKGILHHGVAAVKVLHSSGDHMNKQFKQELDVLGRMYHPHLVLLLGACPDHGCLVYEYMENGSLDDRLQYKDNTTPIPWFYRFKIAWEVASALAFLHNAKPEPIIHRDLKPANILLDYNYVSKICDVGLSTMLPVLNFSTSTIYKDTAPVGTICYIDPEYQRTGKVSPKSDIFSLGIVVLQLLTGKPAIGVVHIVESALEDGNLRDVLDSMAGEWPEKETRELAELALACVELRGKDRPNLVTEVLPVLERLKKSTFEVWSSTNPSPALPPSHFICPILQEVTDPCIASDCYTYDRKAIETWIRTEVKSPVTNLSLPDINLIPNHSLRSAILDWKSSPN